MMMLDLSVRNFGPFRDLVTLSMGATTSEGGPDNVFPCGPVREGMLTSALIYGANASGKSCLIRAVSVLQTMLGSTHPTIGGCGAYQPFRLSGDTVSAPVEMRMRMVLGGVLHDYAVSYDRDSIVSESLHHYPKGRRARVFERAGQDIILCGGRTIASGTDRDTPYLPVASEQGDEVCSAFRRAVLEGITVIDGSSEDLVRASWGRVSGCDELRDCATKALGILDLDITEHVRDTEVGSAGVRSMIGLIGPLVEVLMRGGVLIVDGFGSDLHPLISRWIVGQFSNGSNPNHSQLIVSTHDITLMDDHDLVRRDQIWFVNRDRGSGRSELYGLTDFDDVLRIKDIRRAYLSGRFDAVPSVRARDLVE